MTTPIIVQYLSSSFVRAYVLDNSWITVWHVIGLDKQGQRWGWYYDQITRNGLISSSGGYGYLKI